MQEKGIMVERVIRISLEELKVVRFYCKSDQCAGEGKAFVEIPAERMASCALKCPVCQTEFRRPNVDDALKKLENAIRTLNTNDFMGVEFVIPEPD